MPSLSPPPYQDVVGSLRWHGWYRQINELLEGVSIDIGAIDNVVITSVADNEVLAFDTASLKWINQTLDEVGHQAQGDVLDDLNTLGVVSADGEMIVGTGAGAFAYESGATLRTSIGVGTGSSPTFTNLTLTGTLDVESTTLLVGTVDAESTLAANGGITGTTLAFTSIGDIEGNMIIGGTLDAEGAATVNNTLHVIPATAGGATAPTNSDDFVIENTGTMGMTLLGDDTSNVRITFGAQSDTTGARIFYNHSTNLLIIGNSRTLGDLAFQTGNNSEKMRLDNNGDLHLGGTSPSARFQVTDAVAASAYFESTLANSTTYAPLIDLVREQATTPEDDDNIAALRFFGYHDGSVTSAALDEYARVAATMKDVTEDEEDGELELWAVNAGTLAIGMVVGAGVYTPNATGGSQGVGSINAESMYVDGTFHSPWTYGDEVGTTSGTVIEVANEVDFTNATEVQVILRFVSTDTANDAPRVRIGPASGVVATGYNGGCVLHNDTTAEGIGSTTDIPFLDNVDYTASTAISCVLSFTRYDPAEHIWAWDGIGTVGALPVTTTVSGYITLAGSLSDIDLVTDEGTANFDLGEVRYRWR